MYFEIPLEKYLSAPQEKSLERRRSDPDVTV